jgi:hypothetical protein
VTIVGQSPPASVSSVAVFTNLPTEFSVTPNASASPPIAYQWYMISGGVTNAVLNATNSGYTFSNLVNVSFYCVATNIVGTAASSPVALTLKSPINSPAAYQAALLTYHPVAYWPLDETSGTTAYDLVGNNNGVYVGGVTLGEAGVSNAIGFGSSSSVRFDGSSSYVDIPVNNLNITGPITVVQWVQTTGEGANTDTEDANFATTLSHGGSSYRVDVDGSGLPHFANPAPDATGANSVADGKWHQLAGVCDGTYEYMYVDGALAATELVSFPPSGSLTDVWIGGDPDYGTDATEPNLDRIFYGNICQVSVLPTALSAPEVAALYAAASFPPILLTNVAPLASEVPAGAPMTFSVTVSGSPPLTYQWSNQSGPILSATNSSYLFNAAPGANSYSVVVSNVYGSIASATAVVIGDETNPPPTIVFNGGTGWQLNAGGVYPSAPAFTSSTDLLLTDNNISEATSGFFNVAQYIGGFIATFNYLESPANGADGATFCIQNSPAGIGAIGQPGGDLAFTGIAPSAAFELDIYDHGSAGPGGNTGGPGIAFGTNGATPYSAPLVPAADGYFSTDPVAITNNNPIYVQIYYSEGVMKVWLIDTALNQFTTSFTVNLPAVIGNGSAYVGFTAATGGVASTQAVSDFTFSYTTPPILSVAAGATPGTVVISWPISVSSLFQLLQSPTVTGPWSVTATAPFPTSPDGTKNQLTLTPGGVAFYQLQLTTPNAP